MGGIEGNSLENPIHLPGIKAVHFRSFLRIFNFKLYPLSDFNDTTQLSIYVFMIKLKYFSIDPVVEYVFIWLQAYNSSM